MLPGLLAAFRLQKCATFKQLRGRETRGKFLFKPPRPLCLAIAFLSFSLLTVRPVTALSMAGEPAGRPRAAALSAVAANPIQSLQSSYDVLIYIVKHILGIDPSIIISLSIFLAAGSTAFRYLSAYLSHYARQYFISSVRIFEEKDLILYHDIMRYVTENHLKGKV